MLLLINTLSYLSASQVFLHYALRLGAVLGLSLFLNSVYGQENRNTIIGAVVIEGATAFKRQTLQNAYFDLVGLNANAANLQRITSRISAYYGEENYYIPEVSIGSHPTIQNAFVVAVKEPTLVSFSVSGGSTRTQQETRTLVNNLRGQIVYSPEQLTYLKDALEQRLQVGIDITPTYIMKGGRNIHANFVLRGAINTNVTVSNEGSDRLGKELIAADTSFYEIIPGVREWYLYTNNTISSSAFRSVGTGLIFNLGAFNEIEVNAGMSKARLEFDDASPDMEFQRQNVSLFWRFQNDFSNSSGINFWLGLLGRNFQQEQMVEDVNEKLRLAEAGYSQYFLADNSTHSWRLTFSKGLDGSGADISGPLADPNTELDFSVVNIGLINQLVFPKQWSLRVDTLGQLSDNNLPFSQQFSIASNATARAFEGGELSGDSGVGVKFELRRNVESSFLTDTWIPYLYYGIGKVKSNLTDQSITGASAGLGVRWFSKYYSGFAELGKPIKEESVYRDSDPRAKISVSVHF